jgi:hypothetical protein
MEAIDTESIEYRGYSIRIEVYLDESHGPPWKEHDGHGPVTDWVSRDPLPGERELNSDRGSKRYYDFKEALKIARRDGWGLSDEAKAELEKKLGRKPTKRDITKEAVEKDFDYLHGWCNDDWHWVGYSLTVKSPDGEKVDDDSCWGFDDQDYMIKEATEIGQRIVDDHIKDEEDRIRMENSPGVFLVPVNFEVRANSKDNAREIMQAMIASAKVGEAQRFSD